MPFWTSETILSRLEELIEPPAVDRVVNGQVELSVGPEIFLTSSNPRTVRQLLSGEQIAVPAGHFAILITEEVVKVPPSAIALISIKSSVKLRGLVNVSGFHVDPGFIGRLVFSVHNAGPNEIVLTRGEPLFLVWFADLDRPTAHTYRGSRQRQMHISSDDTMKLNSEIVSPSLLSARLAVIEQRLSRRREWLLVLAGVLGGFLVSLLLIVVERAV